MSFYNNYLVLCNSVGKTPSAVALEIGFSKSTVSRWKAGQNANDATLQKVADYFGCSISELTSEMEQKEKPTIVGEPLPKITQDLISDITKLSLEEQQAMWIVVQAIISKREEDK